MNESVTDREPSIFAELVSGPDQLFFTALCMAIGAYHLVLSIRILAARRPAVAPGVHAILLFSAPSLTGLSLLAMLPTTIPDLFVYGIDAEQPPRHTLRLVSALSWLSIFSFIPNLVLCLLALTRSERRT